MSGFELDPRLARDTRPIAMLGLCDLRLMDDSRWPWVILIPQRNGVTEFHDLAPLDQAMLTFEMSLVARCLKETLRAEKLNIATLGNVVPMFHLHVIARMAGDANWPGPVWGFGKAVPYEGAAADGLVERLRDAVLAA